MPNSILEAALSYREKGYTPIPLNGKRPKYDDWQKQRNVSEAQVREWFANGANVGIVCGEASKNLVVLDCDSLHNYAAFCERFPALAETYTVITGSGKGMHSYFYVDELPPIVDAKAINGDKESNIEIKTNGRQVAAPPSIHPDTKKAYEVHRRLPIMRLPNFWEVVDWVRSFQENEEWNPPQHINPQPTDKELNPALLAALQSHFEGGRHKIHHDWLNCPCPNKQAHKNGDKHPTFGYNLRSGWGHCFRCGTISTKALCEHTGIDWKSLGGFFIGGDRPAAYRKEPRVNLELPPSGSPLAEYGMARNDGLAEYNRRLINNTAPIDPPLHSPLSALYELGGYCRVIPPGRLVFIVGSSGTGKTSMLETIVDKWTPMGYDVIVWTPEWSGDEMIERAVQRSGGARLEDLYLHQIALSDQEKGWRTAGKILDEAVRLQSTNISEDLAATTGTVFYLGAKELRSLDFKQLLPEVKTALYREQRRRYRAVLLDYAQLMHACEDKDVSMYQVLVRIKQACLACGMVGIVATQTTKSDTRAGAQGTLLDASSARFVNEDAANLFITLNLEQNPPGNGLPYSTGVLNVTKNSIGRKGKVRVFTELEKLSWLDKKHFNQDFSMYEK